MLVGNYDVVAIMPSTTWTPGGMIPMTIVHRISKYYTVDPKCFNLDGFIALKYHSVFREVFSSFFFSYKVIHVDNITQKNVTTVHIYTEITEIHSYLVVASFSPFFQSQNTMAWLSSSPTDAKHFPSAVQKQHNVKTCYINWYFKMWKRHIVPIPPKVILHLQCVMKGTEGGECQKGVFILCRGYLRHMQRQMLRGRHLLILLMRQKSWK